MQVHSFLFYSPLPFKMSIQPGLLEAWTISISPDDAVVASGTQHGRVNIWNMQEGHEKVATLETHNKFVLGIAFSRGESDVKLVTSAVDGFVNLFDMTTQQNIWKVEFLKRTKMIFGVCVYSFS